MTPILPSEPTQLDMIRVAFIAGFCAGVGEAAFLVDDANFDYWLRRKLYFYEPAELDSEEETTKYLASIEYRL